MSEMRVCTKGIVCGGDPQPIENFGWKNRLPGKRHVVCKRCTAVRSSNWYYENQERQKENVRRNNQNYREVARVWIRDYLLSHPCSSCGETDPRVLEFHHEGNKENEVSRLIGRGASLDALQAEVANCHRRLTADERGWFKGRSV